MLSDSISLGIALIAFTLGAKQANTNKTLATRFEILAAVLNGITLMLIAIYIFMKLLRCSSYRHVNYRLGRLVY